MKLTRNTTKNAVENVQKPKRVDLLRAAELKAPAPPHAL